MEKAPVQIGNRKTAKNIDKRNEKTPRMYKLNEIEAIEELERLISDE